MALIAAVLIGMATFYDAGVMEQVTAYRGLDCRECIGAVALLEPEHIGRRVWLRAPGRTAEGPFLVADCAQQAHVADLVRRGFVVDVDWPTAQRWGMRGPLANVQVLWTAPPAPQMRWPE